MATALLFINPRNRGQQAGGLLHAPSRPVPLPAGGVSEGYRGNWDVTLARLLTRSTPAAMNSLSLSCDVVWVVHVSHQHPSAAAAACSVITTTLIHKLHFPQTSPVIIVEAYFKCVLINHVTLEVPWAPEHAGRYFL